MKACVRIRVRMVVYIINLGYAFFMIIIFWLE
jgi:hypothetical protein